MHKEKNTNLPHDDKARSGVPEAKAYLVLWENTELNISIRLGSYFMYLYSKGVLHITCEHRVILTHIFASLDNGTNIWEKITKQFF